MNYLEWIKQEVEAHRSWSLILTTSRQPYTWARYWEEWISNPVNDWENCKAFCEMIGEPFE